MASEQMNPRRSRIAAKSSKTAERRASTRVSCRPRTFGRCGHRYRVESVQHDTANKLVTVIIGELEERDEPPRTGQAQLRTTDPAPG
jgi:hypothetical protein